MVYTKKMKKQGQKDREDERLGAEVGSLKKKVKKMKGGGSGGNPWTKHVASVRSKNKGKSLKEVLQMASKSYKKK